MGIGAAGPEPSGAGRSYMYLAVRCLHCKHGIDGRPDIVRMRVNGHAHDYTDLHGVEAEFVIEEWTGDSEHTTGWLAMREDLRRVMRTGGQASGNAVVDDLIREIAEWHDAGRPDVDETIRRTMSETEAVPG